jgi:hypothetical protein
MPKDLEDHRGYHRVCFQRFTNHIHKLPVVEPVEPTCSNVKPSPSLCRSFDNLGQVLFPIKMHCVKVFGTWVRQPTSLFEYGGGQTVIDVATKRQDEPLITLLCDEDLFAREVQYHPVCRRIYTSDPAYGGAQIVEI